MPRKRDDCVYTSTFNGSEVKIDLDCAKSRLEAHDQAKSYVERFVRLLEQKAELAGDIADLKAEAKGNGYVPKALVELAKREMESAEKRAERIALQEEIDRLEAALGVFVGAPLGRSAMERTAHA